MASERGSALPAEPDAQATDTSAHNDTPGSCAVEMDPEQPRPDREEAKRLLDGMFPEPPPRDRRDGAEPSPRVPVLAGAGSTNGRAHHDGRDPDDPWADFDN